MQISIFKNARSTEPVNVDFSSIIKGIQSGRWKEKIDHLRALSKGDYDQQKKDLPAVTFSGTFKERKASEIDVYSQVVVLDIDHLDFKQIVSLKAQMVQDEYVGFAFISPSGNGLKILVKVNTGPEHHLAAFLHLQKVFEEKYCLKVDDSGKDISRLCFVSYDDCAITTTGKVFEVDIRYGEARQYVIPEGLKNYKAQTDIKLIFDTCVKWVEKTCSYSPGGRNRFVHALACALNRVGVSEQEANNSIKQSYDLDHKEIDHCCRSAFFHNTAEHGTVEFKDISSGIKEFKAPPYIANFTDDVVVNDLMQITCNLHYHKVPADDIFRIVGKVAQYYKHKGYIDFERKSLGKIMNEAIQTLNEKVQEETNSLTMNYVAAENILADLIDSDIDDSAISTTFPDFDKALRGGLVPGNVYGLIGFGGTYKSILAQYISANSAYADKPVLYGNGEMSGFQYYERLALMTIRQNLYALMQQKKLHKGNMQQFIDEMNVVLKNNLFVINGADFNEEGIYATLNNIKAKHDKKVGLLVIDGLTQFRTNGLAEIPAAIENSRIIKEIAKNANDGEGIAVLVLIHVSGEQNKLMRDTGTKVRGGAKVLANLDGYLSTSLLFSEENNSLENQGQDIVYVKDKFFLKLVDKRGSSGITNAIISVDEHLKLTVESLDTNKYEIQPK